jgi:hypothetical protein
MLCPGCLRDVPDLVGPHEDLCPECFGIAADVVIPSLLSALEDGEPGDILFEESEGWTGSASGAAWSYPEEEEIEADPLFPRSLLDDVLGPGEDRRRPTFRGRPRF